MRQPLIPILLRVRNRIGNFAAFSRNAAGDSPTPPPNAGDVREAGQAIRLPGIVLSPKLLTLILLLVFVAFGASLTAPFHFDDYAILSDPVLTSPSGWWQVWRIEQSRPLTYFTFWINYQLGGRNPAGYHAVNLLLHLGAVSLLYLCLRKLIPAVPAAIATALFALHPVQTEPVVYIFARAIVLAALLCFASLLCWLKGRHWLAVGWFILALLAKEECAAYPLVLFLLYLSISRNPGELRAIGAMLAAAAAFGVRVLLATRTVEGAGANAGVTTMQYFSTQGPMILRYLAMLILPSGYSVDPPVQVAPPLLGALAWTLVIGMAVAALRRFSRAREGFWFVAGLVLLLPSSSLFPVADLAVDRRMYLPLAAFSAAIALLIRTWRWPLAAALCIGLAALSFFRTQVWLSEKTLWEEAARLAPSKLRPKIQLARVSEPARALEILREAKNLAPDDPRVASELGRVHLEMKNPTRALQEFGRALALSPNDPRAVINRGVVLLLLAQKEAARADFEHALQMDPCLADARWNLSRMGIAVPESAGCRK